MTRSGMLIHGNRPPGPSSAGHSGAASRVRGGEPRGRAEGRPRESAARWRRSAEATAGNGRARARWGPAGGGGAARGGHPAPRGGFNPLGTQLSRCGERALRREAGQRGGHRFTADAAAAAMRTAAISGVQGLREAVGEPLKSLQSRDLGGAWPSYVDRPAPAARVLSGTVETPGSGLPTARLLCRGLTAQPPAL